MTPEDVVPSVGARFEDAAMLDLSWQPGNGEKGADRPHVIMRIVKIDEHTVWFAPDDDSPGLFRTAHERLGKRVGRWLT